jgi:hypothetical protein
VLTPIAVLDLARLLLGLCPRIFATPDARAAFLGQLLAACEWDGAWEKGGVSNARLTNVLLTLRAVSNAYQPGAGVEGAGAILAALEKAPYGVLGKTQRGALTTLLYKSVFISLCPRALSERVC